MGKRAKSSEAESEYTPWVMQARAWLGPALKRFLVPSGSTKRRWWWNRLFIQVDRPYFFAGETRNDIREKLKPAAGRASELRTEAQRINDDELERREHVERRATALQGAVAIAFGFALAGGALMLDPKTLPDERWRNLVAAAYLATLICLAATAGRALRGTVRVHAYHHPDPSGPAKRATGADDEAELERAAELLYVYSRNQPIVDYQVTQMRAAGHWFALAIIGLVVTASLICGALVDRPTTQRATSAASDTRIRALRQDLQIARLEATIMRQNARLQQVRLTKQQLAATQSLAP
jgi:hypothetical protein